MNRHFSTYENKIYWCNFDQMKSYTIYSLHDDEEEVVVVAWAEKSP